VNSFVTIYFKNWFWREGRLTFLLFALGAVFVAVGVHGFWARPQHFTRLNGLGCVVGAAGGYFLLIIADYLLHHARLVFIPWMIVISTYAAYEPHLSVGLGAALWFMLATQL